MNSGLRERKKADTRRALVETAVRLCLERGYGAVTVSDITDEVGVSRRTFSNYFDGLPQCLAAFGITVLDDLLEVISATQPAPSNSREILHIGLNSFAERMGSGLDDYERLMASSPDLVGAEFACQRELIDRVGAKVNDVLALDPDDVRAVVFAGSVVHMAHTVSHRWIEGGRPGGVPGLQEQLRLAAEIFDLTALSPGS